MYILRKKPVYTLRYLPDFLSKDDVFKNTALICDKQHEKLRVDLLDLKNQIFIETATWRLADWERVLNISVKPNATYDERRNQILLKFQGANAVTEKFMNNLINMFCENKTGYIVPHNSEYYFEVCVSADDKINWKELLETVNLYKPAHLAFYTVLKILLKQDIYQNMKINQYINDITEVEEGAIILKDRIILKNSSVVGTISYTYKESFESFGVSEFTKQDVINYANSSKIVTLYVSIFLTIFIYAFIMYLLTIISNVVLLSFFGYITTLLARIKMRYVAVFNMSAYALTLSVILNMLYVAVNIFVPFTMEYFQVMYVAVAAIYLVAAILILKADFMKKQLELMKIAEAEAIVKKEMEQEEKDNKEKEERRKKDKEEEKKNREHKKKEDKEEKENLGNEAEGSNA